MHTRADYVRHAERYGPELVFETAAEELPVRELGYLSLRMKTLFPKWRLPVDSFEFASLLVADGVSEQDACRMAMVSRRTFQRRKVSEHVDQEPNPGDSLALERGEIATNRLGPTEDLRTLDLSL